MVSHHGTPGGTSSRGTAHRPQPSSRDAAHPPAVRGGLSRGLPVRGGHRGGRGGRGAHTNHLRDERWAPHGICRTFYHDGTCQWGLDCHYQHRSKDPNADSPEVSPSIPGNTDDFYLQDVPSNALHGEFKTVLERMIKEPFLNVRPATIYIFVRGLLASTKETAAWTFQDTQSMLARLAVLPSNLNSRLRDILAWPEVSTSSNGSHNALLFQSSLVPLFIYMSSKTVVNSPSAHHVNALYTLLDANVEAWAPKTTACLQEMMARRSFKPSQPLLGAAFKPTDFLVVLVPLAKMLSEYLSRFDKAMIFHGSHLVDLVQEVQSAFQQYSADILSTTPTFDDPTVIAMDSPRRHFRISEASRDLQRLDDIIDRIQGRRAQARPQQQLDAQASVDETALVKLRRQYDEPGHLRRLGPRHDNDNALIADIELLPTHAELVCETAPYLPGNVPSAPHHLGVGTMERQIDVVFRLLRENTVGPIRSAVQSLRLDLRGPRQRQLTRFLQEGGGRWRAADSSNAVDLNVYGDVSFTNLAILHQDLVVELSLKAPKSVGTAREGNKKLARGGLVGLLLRQVDTRGVEVLNVFLGEISEDVAWSAGGPQNRRGSVKVTFHDSAVFASAIQHLDHRNRARRSPMTFFEVPGVLLGTLVPFLKRLQAVEPSSIPFGRWIAGTTDASTPLPPMEPPRFARSPEFAYDLSSFLRPGAVDGGLKLLATDSASVEHARSALKEHSSFDDSQADAFVESMTREVAMIQGPPGTGKSWIGVKLVKMLLENNIGPILVIAYTNHALDQFLHDIYLNVTKEIIRCGSKSKDPIIQALNLYDATQEAGVFQRSSLRQELRDETAKKKAIVQDLNRLCTVVSLASTSSVSYSTISDYLRTNHPLHAALLASAPAEVVRAWETSSAEGWQTVGQQRRSNLSPLEAPFVWWKEGWDLDLMETLKSDLDDPHHRSGRSLHLSAAIEADNHPHQSSLGRFELLQESDVDDSDDDEPDWVRSVLNAAVEPNHPQLEDLGASSDDEDSALAFLRNWTRPEGRRSLLQLIDSTDVWSLSLAERRALVAHWVEHTLEEEIPKLSALRQSLRDVTARINALRNQNRIEVVRKVKIIGSTTNGAANLLELLTAVGPRILIVEEAGECLESHLLANLVPSIEQLILIGDPLQLRPHIENYQLSVDSSSGKLYRLDESLFERLVNAKLPYSVLQTQRRMRPEISALVRNYLYPNLVDHPAVLNYPSLKGLARNVLFFDHRHAEDKQQRESSSKANSFEARLVADLVVHFINQGYQPGDIAVITPYLGQVRILQRLLSELRLEVELDDRDVAELNRMADTGEDEDAESELDVDADSSPKTFEQRSADSLVTLRSVDNFQGEEAKIVLLSLTRNVGHVVDEEGAIILDRAARASIGFLKSPNRTNVALSRAKHGMVILGNATLFAENSPMWRSVIQTLQAEDAVAESLPIRCEQHPEEISFVKEPGIISQLSPQGGCLRRCGVEMPCHHRCPRVCHPTDRKHINTRCIEPCAIVLDCGHACRALCGDKHVCDWIEKVIQLSCGHTRLNVPCALARDPESLVCRTMLSLVLPCQHTVSVLCGTDTSAIVCNEKCDMALDCRHGSCKRRCGLCRPPSYFTAPSSSRPKVKHGSHPCGKVLNCKHECRGDCQTHSHTGCGLCESPCERKCEHGGCSHKCGRDACRSCLEACAWKCEHRGACGNTCSMPCARLPCDEPCSAFLECGHRCPSICGEDCSRQICPSCAISEEKEMVVDMLMMTTLAEVDLDQQGLDQRIISLSCGHTFTVETLDGIFELEKHYSRVDGNWAGVLDVTPGALHPIVCPQCRQPISHRDSRRYGRPLKMLDLGLQEDSALLRGNAELRSVATFLAEFDVDGLSLDVVDSLRHLTPAKTSAKFIKAFRKTHLGWNLAPITSTLAYRDLSSHGISPSIAAIWTKATRPLLDQNQLLERLAKFRAPLTIAYEAAFTKLLREAKEELGSTAAATDSTEPSITEALREAYAQARLLIGAPPPRSSSKNSVEAIWLSLRLRSKLASVGQRIADRLRHLDSASNAPKDLQFNLGRFEVFLRFILETSVRDATWAVQIARLSSATRQELQALLLVGQHQLALTRFDTERHVASSKRDKTYDPKAIASGIRAQQTRVVALLDSAVDSARNGLRGNVEAIKALDDWLQRKIWPASDLIASEWDRLISYAEAQDFYEPVDAEERKLVIEAMSSGVSSSVWPTGHWYRCPNGHPYVIGECGQAMENAVCPECGAGVGGQNHTSAIGNVRDEEMELLHRRTLGR